MSTGQFCPESTGNPHLGSAGGVLEDRVETLNVGGEVAKFSKKAVNALKG